ncbi:MAG: CvpA family protein [Bryobacterales bacterium]|nr:CvpA family protein [Bryobacterales bacterium]MBV9399411.1 CvpA family protein [Bryobacterales bacterium]
MSFLDLLLALVLVASVITGFTAGFARAGVGFCAVIAGILFGYWFYGVPAAWMNTYLNSDTASDLLGFLVVFLAFVVAGALVGAALAKIFKWTGLTWLDRLLGGAFGIVRGALVSIALVSVLLAFAPRPLPGWIVDSRLLPYVAGASSVATAVAPRAVTDAFHNSLAEIRKLWDERVRKLAPPANDNKVPLKKADA